MLKEEVYHYLTLIPKHKVVTYGQIASALGNKNMARAIGNILHVNPEPILQPCFRVVNREGKLAEHFGDGIEMQRKRLLEDGIEVVKDTVDLKEYQWQDQKRLIHVAAAVIQKEGRILVCQRKDGAQKGYWEFPGGKYEAKETGEECITREIREELGITVSVLSKLCSLDHEYDGFHLWMDVYLCESSEKEIHLFDHEAMRWIDPKEDVNWLEADRKVIDIYRGSIK